MRRHSLLPLPVTCALAALACAQTPAFRGGDFIVANDRSGPGLYRVQSGGLIQPIPVGVTLNGLAGVVGTRQGELVISDWSNGNVIFVPPTGAARVLANVPGGLRIAEDIDGSFLVTSFRSNSIVRVTRSGQTSTVLALTSPARPYDVVVDENGDYIFCQDLSGGSLPKGVFRADRATGTITPLYTGGGLPLAHGLAFFANGDLAIVDGINDEVYRLDRNTGVLSVFVGRTMLGNNPDSITETGDGGFLIALESASLGFAVAHVDRFGNVTTVASNGPFTNLEEVAVVPALTGPTDLVTGTGVSYPLRLELPSQPNRLYAIGLAASIYPGIPLPGDPRALTVNPDGLYMQSLTGGLAPIFVNWLGATDSAGLASPSLDLSFLAPGALAGFTGFAQGFAADFSASSGIGALTNPLRIDFR